MDTDLSRVGRLQSDNGHWADKNLSLKVLRTALQVVALAGAELLSSDGGW